VEGKLKKKMMKRIKFILLLCLFGTIPTLAQTYTNAAGIKAGYSSGLAFKHFFESEIALEAQALFNPHGFQFTLFYEYHYSPHPKERLHYFAGAGPHIGNWDEDFALGAALLLGTEFIFRKAPLMIGLEWKPMLNIFRQTDLVIPDIALTAKVVIK
jgi:hypothetical protein